PDLVGDLDGRESDAARCRGDHDRLAGFQIGKVDKCPVGGQVLHPDRRRLGPGERSGMMSHGMDRGIRKVAVEPVVIQREAWDSADRVADLEALDTRPNRGHGSRRLVPQSGGKLGLFHILAPAKHSLGAVQSQCMDADLYLALSGRRDFDLLDPEDFGPTDLVKPYNSRHASVLLYVIPHCSTTRYSTDRGNRSYAT